MPLATAVNAPLIQVTPYVLPIFMVAIAAEWFLTRKRSGYSAGTALADVSAGGVFQGLELMFHVALLPAYAWLYGHARLVTWQPDSWQPWLIGLVGMDVLFYWWHRCSHVINVLWAVHGVHHQSEDFNLAVALRQPAFEPLTWFLFYAPLALVGVDLQTYLLCYGVNRFYQFWIHTELVDKLGPLEWLLNTPSHHRVHHGVQDQYLDKNYGAILIVWDRLFGTFEVETVRPLYGTTVPLASYNPVWANLKLLADIGALARRATTVREKLWAWVAHPGWQPNGPQHVPAVKRTDANYAKYRPTTSSTVRRYVLGHYVLVASLAGPFLQHEQAFDGVLLVLGALTLILTHTNLCGLMEGKTWAVGSEILRFVILAATLWLGLDAWTDATFSTAIVAETLTLCGLSLIWLRPNHRGERP